MAESHFDTWIAAHYETLWPELFEPAALDPVIDVLADLAAGGPVLEFGIGTGRIAVPLHRRGIDVHGIELSPAMAARLHANPDADGIELTLGDFATATAGGPFTLVYLLRNTITNLTTQDEQVRAFVNAAAHLRPGGCFLVENYVPQLRRLPPGQDTRIFTATPTHLGYETYDTATQIAVSHHHWTLDGQHVDFSSPHRYAWPAELDLMARLAGLTLRSRWADWHHAPFTTDSDHHISIWTTPSA
jgi:SAM-dependent methyltransferase